jgi:hypothetical protein
MMAELGDMTRDVRVFPRAGDTFRAGALWVRVERVWGYRVVLCLIRPGVGERTVAVAVPLPEMLVPTSWSRTDLAWASAQVVTQTTSDESSTEMV